MTATYGTFPNSTETTPLTDAAALAAVTTSTLYNGYRLQVNGLGVFKLNKDSTATPDNVTVIAALNGGRWLKDLTPSLLLNTSNEIDGSQIASAGTIQADDGSATTPSYTFVNDTNTGMYRSAANTIAFTTDGTQRATMSNNAFIVTTVYRGPDGGPSLPTFSFTNEFNTGLFLAAPSSLGFTIAGTQRLTLSATALSVTTKYSAPDGTAAAPTFTFTSDVATGIFKSATSTIGIATAGVIRLSLSTTGFSSTLPIIAPAGSAGAPGVRVGSEQTGIFSGGVGILAFAGSGSSIGMLSATAFNIITGSVFQINSTKVLGAPVTGFVVPAGTSTADLSGLNGDTATADDATIRVVIQGIKAIMSAGLTHGFLAAP